CEVLAELELKGLLHAWRESTISEPEMLSEYPRPDGFIINNLGRRARRKNPALVDDVRTVADAEGFAHVVVGDEHADAALLQESDDLLDVEDRDRVDARE